jgi:hypothetical protein
MRPRTRRNPVDALLREADPIQASSLDGERLATILDELGADIISRPRRTGPRARTRRLNKRRAALLLAGVALVIGAGVATGAHLGAHTGTFPTPAEERMGGPGEALNPAASDFGTVASEVASDIPYPPGYESWRNWVISIETEHADGGGLESTGALHGWFAASAFCAWVQSWRQATIAGDPSAATRAAQTIAQAPEWKAVTNEDPHPDPSAANDPGAETGTLFGWMLPYRDAVLNGDRAEVERLLAAGYGGKCWLYDPDWMAQEQAHAEEWRDLSPSELGRKYEQFLASARP